MNLYLVLFLTGIMLFSYWLNYVMGGPLSDDDKSVDVKAMLFFFPNWLAIRRLKKIGIYDSILGDYYEEMQLTKDPKTRNQLRLDKKKDIYLAGREFFTWERAILCPICFHWWLSVIAGVILISWGFVQTGLDYFTGFLAYLVNHLIIRKIS